MYRVPVKKFKNTKNKKKQISHIPHLVKERMWSQPPQTPTQNPMQHCHVCFGGHHGREARALTSTQRETSARARGRLCAGVRNHLPSAHRSHKNRRVTCVSHCDSCCFPAATANTEDDKPDSQKSSESEAPRGGGVPLREGLSGQGMVPGCAWEGGKG